MKAGGQLRFDLRRRTRSGRVAKRLGRKPSGTRRDPRHRVRPEVVGRHPVHVVLRVAKEVGNLRRGHAYRALRGALRRCASRSDYRVVHISIQANHVHLLVEADHKQALTRGMQGFAISAAKRLNRELRRPRGEVFPYRYHATAITTPSQARNAISYVLNNWRHHREDWHSTLRVDPYSSAYAFGGWEVKRVERPPDPLPVVAPTAWLLTNGWRRAGDIYTYELPGPDPRP